MPSLSTILKTGCFLIPLVFGTHYIRTWAFNRYEAVTYECSSAVFLISVLQILTEGYSWQFGLLTVILLLAIIGNTCSQWRFYVILQERIKEKINYRFNRLIDEKKTSRDVEKLQTMAMVTIMPSFSRFIEESKAFNNPGNIIGLIKSLMKRQRFLKKKYLMRELFAECVNMIGPCKPGNQKAAQDKDKIPSAIHAYDLALNYEEEKKGLLSFDVLGFGGLADIWFYLALNYDQPFQITCHVVRSDCMAAVLVFVVLVFTVVSLLLRHFAFARYESFGYELSFSSLVATSFLLYRSIISQGEVSMYGWAIFVSVLVGFLTASIIHHGTDKGLHKKINKNFDTIIESISPTSETNRNKRLFLKNMKTISIWAIVPFFGNSKCSEIFVTLMPTKKMKEFEMNNQERIKMPKLMRDLLKSVVPELNNMIKETDFETSSKKISRLKRLINTIGIADLIIMYFWIKGIKNGAF